jgi:hypothetical protein
MQRSYEPAPDRRRDRQSQRAELRTMGSAAAIVAIAERANAARGEAAERWSTAAPGAGSLERWARRFQDAGRVTLNFHPDRLSRSGRTVAAGLAHDGWYRSQWVTGISAGSRSAVRGGARHRFEHDFFAGAYGDAQPSADDRPVYGSFDLLLDDHGGSPRFGSSFVVLRSHLRDRTTLCVGDSHVGPRDVGTFAEPSSILAGLAEQADRGDLLHRAVGTDVLLGALTGTYRSGRATRDLDGYVEIQVHGGVSLADDVEKIVLDPSFRGSDVERDLTTAARRYGFELAWHRGSELHADDVPADFRGPTMPLLAQRVARPDGIVDARAIGVAAARERFEEPLELGDPPASTLQQLKYLWHTLLAHGSDTTPR